LGGKYFPSPGWLSLTRRYIDHVPDYAKQHLSYEEQVERLVARGMEVPSRADAIQALSRIGYYRLSAYSHQFRIPNRPSMEGHDQRHSRFLPGVAFSHMMGLWEFDRKLRLLCIDGLERFEIALRTSLAYTVGKHGPFVHLDAELLDPGFTAQPPTTSRERLSKYDEWLIGLYDRQASAANEAFVAWFAYKYNSKLPLWVAVEILEMGQLSYLYQGSPRGDRDKIAGTFGLRSSKQFKSWIASLNGIRNTSAHHSRLWNRTLINQASRPKRGEVAMLDHLQDLSDGQRKKLYPTLAILTWLLTTSIPSGDWYGRLVRLLDEFPVNPIVDLGNGGFPEDWRSLPLWNRSGPQP
jgi:abortive infection bacteriophage resistance protein